MRFLKMRFAWIWRSYLPHAVAAVPIFLLYRSIGTADLEPWADVDYQAIARLEFDSLPSGDLLLRNLTTLNVATRCLIAVAVLVFAWYLSDLFTTGRKSGWMLIAAYGSTSRITSCKVWLALLAFLLVVVAGTTAAVHCGLLAWDSAVKWLFTIDFALLNIMMTVNRTFESYKLLLPTLDARRKEQRDRRELSRQERAQRRQQDEERRRQLQEMRQQLDTIRQQIDGTDHELHELRRSDHDTQLVEERAAELMANRHKLQEQLRQLTIAYPDRV